jgi:hypothetical protein
VGGLKELSSKWTFALKYLYPCIWFLGVPFIYVIIVGFGGLAPDKLKLAFYAIWLMLGLLYTVTYYDLKKVGLEKDFLYITNYEKDETINLDLVENVIEKKIFFGGRRITILFNEQTEFGKEVSFLAQPPVLSDPRLPHPVVNEIKVASDEYKYFISFAKQEKARQEKKEDLFGYF